MFSQSGFAVPVCISVSWARHLQQFIWENLLWFPCTVYRSIVIVLYIDGEDNDLLFSRLEEVSLAAKSQWLDTNYSYYCALFAHNTIPEVLLIFPICSICSCCCFGFGTLPSFSDEFWLSVGSSSCLSVTFVLNEFW